MNQARYNGIQIRDLHDTVAAALVWHHINSHYPTKTPLLEILAICWRNLSMPNCWTDAGNISELSGKGWCWWWIHSVASCFGKKKTAF